MLLSTLHLMPHQMGMSDIKPLDSYFLGKQSKTQGKKTPKHNLKQSPFLAGEESFHWPRVVCLVHQGKLPNPKNRFWGNLALSRAFPLLMNPSWPPCLSISSSLLPFISLSRFSLSASFSGKTSLTLFLLYATPSLK